MSQKKIKIGGTQINNGFSGQYYLPYSVGLLYAFIIKKPRGFGSKYAILMQNSKSLYAAKPRVRLTHFSQPRV